MDSIKERLSALLKKYREVISYLVFGVLTTAVNYISYLILSPFFWHTTIPTVIAWVLSVLFAYVTNRRFVFRSHTGGKKALGEAGAFFAARALSGVLDVLFMAVFSDWLGFNDKIIKLVSNVFVVIFNYVASKLVIFKKH